MAIEIIGKRNDVDRYRKYLHECGHYTKFFMKQRQASGLATRELPEGYRTFNTPIKSFYSKQKGANKKEIDFEDRIYIAGVANENINDRMEERLEPTGIDINNFQKNPILLADHYYVTSHVLGQVVSLDPQSDGVKFEAYIGDPKKGPLTEIQRLNRSLVAQELLKTVSVGFIPHKIKAPEFDGEGRLVEAPVILAWELLEISVVAIPCNAGSVFEARDIGLNTNAKKTLPNLISPSKSTKINQSNQKAVDRDSTYVLIFEKSEYTVEDAIEWAKANEYKTDSVDDQDESVLVYQRDEEEFESDTFKTIEIEKGVKAKIGQLKGDIEDEKIMEEKLVEMLDLMKSLKSTITSLSEGVNDLKSTNERILGFMDEKPKEDEDEEKKLEDEKEDEEKEDEEKEKKFQKQIDEIRESVAKQGSTIELISQSLLKIFEK